MARTKRIALFIVALTLPLAFSARPKSTTVAEVAAADRRLGEACLANDIRALDAIYAADVTLITPAGTMLARDRELEVQ